MSMWFINLFLVVFGCIFSRQVGDWLCYFIILFYFNMVVIKVVSEVFYVDKEIDEVMGEMLDEVDL